MAGPRHGMSRHRAYHAWSNARVRYEMGEPWRSDFRAFWADMGPSWAPGKVLYRLNQNEPFRASNCRWGTKGESIRRGSRVTWGMVAEIRKLRNVEGWTLAALSERFGISVSHVCNIATGSIWGKVGAMTPQRRLELRLWEGISALDVV